MPNNMDKGTVIRTVLLFLAFANQILAVAGKEPIPVSDDDVSNIYLMVSTIITFAVSIWTWFKNNYITKKGQAQKAVLKANGLTDDK
jgi:SPP1 family holin